MASLQSGINTSLLSNPVTQGAYFDYSHPLFEMTSSHVIIRGHVFPYAEKAPFVASGMSVLGAMEYEKERDLVKCHECGEWFNSIGRHCPAAHGITARDYKLKHGLRFATGLIGVRLRERCKDLFNKVKPYRHLTHDDLRSTRAKGAGCHAKRQTAEMLNANGTCRAQTLFRIQMLGASLGHTPTRNELKAAKLSDTQLRSLFGCGLTAIMKLAGLVPNPPRRTKNGLDDTISLDQRMPWPEEYFAVNPLEKRRG